MDMPNNVDYDEAKISHIKFEDSENLIDKPIMKTIFNKFLIEERYQFLRTILKLAYVREEKEFLHMHRDANKKRSSLNPITLTLPWNDDTYF